MSAKRKSITEQKSDAATARLLAADVARAVKIVGNRRGVFVSDVLEHLSRLRAARDRRRLTKVAKRVLSRLFPAATPSAVGAPFGNPWEPTWVGRQTHPPCRKVTFKKKATK